MHNFAYLCKIMKSLFRFSAYLMAAIASVSCAKTITESSSEAERRAFEAWVEVHYPGNAERVGNGIYILDSEEHAGTGAEVETDKYILYNYTVRNLSDSSITAFTTEDVAKAQNLYDSKSYYGPRTLLYSETGSSVTIHEILTGGGKYPKMKVGGKRTAIVPGYISGSTVIRASEQEYIDAAAKGTNIIYTLEITGMVDDIYKAQKDKMEAYVKSHGGVISEKDTTGFYYIKREGDSEQKMPSDTTVYIEYIGRLLSGKVFDTNIKDTAIKYGLGTRTSSYSPMSVTWSSDSTALKLSGNEVIKGFSYTLWQMHPFEKGTGIFNSKWGYGENGSGSSIPGYEPLIFEIDIVAKP